MNKIKIGIIFGGQSFEHEVSKMTAKSIIENIDRELFDFKEIYITKDGNFDEELLNDIDVAFLAVHGPNCEDGKLQKYLEIHKIKYTGPGVEASKINMNKTRMHEVFKNNNLPVVEYKGFNKIDLSKITAYINQIGLPVIIKPNNMGSSVGMTKINKINELPKALRLASECDSSVIIEKAVFKPREIEIAILGNNNLIISEPGEVLTKGEIYSYETKYENPFETTINANLSVEETKKVKEIALKAYKATGCKGYSRVDFLMDNINIYINEINTLPGFTSISMFPKLMAKIGIDYKTLITKIINLALE